MPDRCSWHASCLQAYQGVVLSVFFGGYATTQILGGEHTCVQPMQGHVCMAGVHGVNAADSSVMTQRISILLACCGGLA